LNPPADAAVTVELADPPAVIDARVSAVAVTVNPGGVCTKSVKPVPLSTDPDTPFTVKGYLPAAKVDDVVTVSADFPEAFVKVAGLNEQLAPVGRPEQESVTEPLNPKVGVTEMVELAELPATTVAGESGMAETVNPAAVVLSSTA
jgi:hypothetical protein